MEIKKNSSRWFSNRYSLSILLAITTLSVNAQTAKEVLDKTAAAISAKSGVQANFTIKSSQLQSSGTIVVKGKKFHATTPQAIIWFDGKTQWTYLKKNEEVNVSTPTESQLAAINPYNFIYLYKKGYTYTLEKSRNKYVVHLSSKDKKKSIQEMYITVQQKSYIPSQIRMKQSKGWTTIDITNFQAMSQSDGIFRFNSKDFPNAEIIDLR